MNDTTSKGYPSFFEGFRICYREAKLQTIVILLSQLGMGIIPIWDILINKYIIQTVINCMELGWKMSQIMLSCILFFLSIFMRAVFELCYDRNSQKLELHFMDHWNMKVLEKISHLDYSYLEMEESANLIQRITKNPGMKQLPQTCLDTSQVLRLFLSILGIITIVAHNSKWSALLVGVIPIPVFLISKVSGHHNYEADRKITQMNRMSDYIEFDVLRGRELAPERTLFGYTRYFNTFFSKYFLGALKKRNKVRLTWTWYKSIVLSVVCILFGGASYLVIMSYQRGETSLSIVIALLNAFIQMIYIVLSDLPRLTEAIAQDQEYLSDISALNKLSNREKKDKKEELFKDGIEKIEFRNVKFRYPGTDRWIFKSLNFVLTKGHHYAFVGQNGCGKTTLVKLLLGFYPIDEGEICVNGINIAEIPVAEYQNLFSVVFQDYVCYEMTVRENIIIGDLQNASQLKSDQLEEILQRTNLWNVINDLPNGIDTPLGKLTEGSVDLSGGQWQRIALARALFNQSSFKILDEPTSALDPLEESRLYSQYKVMLRGQSSIFISHRLGSTKLADYIFVVDDGQIKEEGTHEKLMSKRGMYEKMFRIQQEWYEEDKVE